MNFKELYRNYSHELCFVSEAFSINVGWNFKTNLITNMNFHRLIRKRENSFPNSLSPHEFNNISLFLGSEQKDEEH